MGELGLLGVPWSEELGGAGMDQLSYYITIHEMAKVDASHALTISAHTNLGTSPIVEFGTEEQRQRYVPLLASGRVLGGFGLTEPGAGSDAGGTATTAVDKGDHYLLNGSKIFITHAGVGEIFSVTARTEPGRGNQGITSFIVTKDTVDLEQCRALGVGHAEDLPKIAGGAGGQEGGQDGLAGQRHPRAHLRGRRGAQGERAGTGRRRVHQLPQDPRRGPDRHRGALARHRRGGLRGGARATPAPASSSAAPSGASRGSASSWPTWRPEIEAGTHLLYHAAWLKQNGQPFKKEAAMAKLYCSELAMRATTKAVQIFGGYGYTTEYPVERMMRDAKVCEIGEGTSEIQRIVIARQILGQIVD